MAKHCPADQILSEYVLGKLPDERIATLERHLAGCGTCQSTINHLERESDTLVQRLRGKADPGPFANEPDLLRGMRQVQSIRRDGPAGPSKSEPQRDAASGAGESAFDPYYTWLGISPKEQPADHYRLLGVNRFEENLDVIESAADRQMSHVRTFQTGKHSADSQNLLNEIAKARLTLLNAEKKKAYDAVLRGKRSAGPAAASSTARGNWPKGKRPTITGEFEQCLLASGVLTPSEYEQFRATIPANRAPREPKDLARLLIQARQLTKYQAAVVYQGLPHPLVYGRYTVLEQIGSGGMGKVYKARHRRMDRLVALKVLSDEAVDSPGSLERFHQEVKAAAQLSHPNIVTAHDADEQDGTHFLVMEYVEGIDLSALVKQSGPLPVRQALEYILQAARGLQYAHSKGIIHRDIKPGNLLVDREGVVQILDMGLARLSETGRARSAAARQLTESGQIMGTLDYMSPEQAEDTRTADHRADIYSLGCTLYRLLTGKPPYAGDTAMRVLLAHREAEIPSLGAARADVPAELDSIFQQMLAKHPDARQKNMGQVVAQLEALLADSPQAKAAPDALPVAFNEPASSTDSRLTAFLQKVAVQPATTGPPAAAGGIQAESNPAVKRLSAGSRRDQVTRYTLVAGLAGVILVLGILLTISTDEGTIVVEADDQDVRVEVKQDGKVVDIIDAKSKWQIHVESGTYDVRLHGGGDKFQLSKNKIVVKDGKRVKLKATLKRRLNEHAEPMAKSPLQPASWIDVISLLDIDRHTIYGNWKKRGNELVCSAANTSRIRLPIEATGDFELETTFTITSLRDAMILRFPVGRGVCRNWFMHSGLFAGLSLLDGNPVNGNETTRALKLKANHRYSWLAQVRLDGNNSQIKVALDGNEIVNWRGDASRLRVGNWDPTHPERHNLCFPGDDVFTLAAVNNSVTFHSIKFRAPQRSYSLTHDRLPNEVTNAPSRANAPLIIRKHANCKGHEAHVRAVAFLPDGSRMVSAGHDHTVRLWDLVTGKELHKFEGHAASVTDVAVFPDGKRAISSSDDDTLILWDLETKSKVRQFRGHAGDVISVALSPDGRRAVSSGHDRVARIWDVETGAQLLRLSQHSWSIEDVAWSPDGKYILTGGGDKHVGGWDAESGKRLWQVAPGNNWIRVGFSPTGRYGMSYRGSLLHIWQPSDGKPIRQFDGKGANIQTAAFLADDTRVLATLDDGMLRIWNLASGEEEQLINHSKPWQRNAWVSTERVLMASCVKDGIVEVWEIGYGKPAAKVLDRPFAKKAKTNGKTTSP